MTDEQQQPTGPSGVRASDQEREEVVNTLKQHMVDGRLDWEEFSERMDKAYAARDRDELAALVSDLPGRQPAGQGAGQGQGPGQGAWAPGPWAPGAWRGGRGPFRAWMGAGRRWPPVPVIAAIVVGVLLVASTIGRLIAFGLWGGGPWMGPGHGFGFFPFFPLFPLLWIGLGVFVFRRLSRRW